MALKNLLNSFNKEFQLNNGLIHFWFLNLNFCIQ